jgi:hypothetical protein
LETYFHGADPDVCGVKQMRIPDTISILI